jgi:hypothetical protein
LRKVLKYLGYVQGSDCYENMKESKREDAGKMSLEPLEKILKIMDVIYATLCAKRPLAAEAVLIIVVVFAGTLGTHVLFTILKYRYEHPLAEGHSPTNVINSNGDGNVNTNGNNGIVVIPAPPRQERNK